MYSPDYNRIEDRPELLAFLRANNFPLLITGAGGTLHGSHLPVTIHEQGSQIVIDMHMAKNNPQWKEFFDDEVMVLFSGPHAYVSPRWYADQERVPTWNYAAVHAYGKLQVMDDPGWLVRHVSELTDQQEASRPAPWATADAPGNYIEVLARGIVGLTLEVTRLEGKLKMSQNRPLPDRAGVVAGLGARAEGQDAAVAALVNKLMG